MDSMPYPASITKALHEVMTKVGYVQKKNRNDFHKYNYAGEGALLEVLRPAMVEAGLILIPSIIDQSIVDEYGNTSVRIAYTLAHTSGDVWPEKIIAVGTGNDKNSKGGIGDKGTYKAITGANKYLLFKLFQIETGDDPETTEEEVTPPAKTEAKPSTLTERYKNFSKALDGVATPAELEKVWSLGERLLDELHLNDPEKYNALRDVYDIVKRRVCDPFTDPKKEAA